MNYGFGAALTDEAVTDRETITPTTVLAQIAIAATAIKIRMI
jgi:hypothetical protein